MATDNGVSWGFIDGSYATNKLNYEINEQVYQAKFDHCCFEFDLPAIICAGS
jgi:hypothetical protein